MPVSLPTPMSATHASGVMGSLQRAASATGVNFDYLLRTAQRESSLNPKARAPTSSAAGLFQFIEQTWLSTLKSAGAKHGYGAYAGHIAQGDDGRYYVSNPQARRDILNLRYDADAAAVMGAELTAKQAAYLKGRIGRDPTHGELYAAHFLGPQGAANLITAAETRPGASASALFPAAARANPTIFYNHGRPRSVTEVLANLTKTGGQTPMTVAPPEPSLKAPKMLDARWDDLRSEQALINLVFGGQEGGQNGGTGTLFATQLMAAFGPGADEDKPKDGFGGAFGLSDTV